jgi:hypothetical protein
VLLPPLLLLLSPPAGHLFKVRDPATGQPLTFAQAKEEMAIMMGAGAQLVACLPCLAGRYLASMPCIHSPMVL